MLSESALIVAALFEAWLVDSTQVDIFDATLVHAGCERLVGALRPVADVNIDNSGDHGRNEGAEAGNTVVAGDGRRSGALRDLDARQRLGSPYQRGGTYYPFSLRQIIEFIFLLPINAIPVVGVPLFLLLTGYRAGPLLHP